MQEIKIKRIQKGDLIKIYLKGTELNLTFKGKVLDVEFPFITIEDERTHKEEMLNIMHITNIQRVEVSKC